MSAIDFGQSAARAFVQSPAKARDSSPGFTIPRSIVVGLLFDYFNGAWTSPAPNQYWTTSSALQAFQSFTSPGPPTPNPSQIEAGTFEYISSLHNFENVPASTGAADHMFPGDFDGSAIAPYYGTLGNDVDIRDVQAKLVAGFTTLGTSIFATCTDTHPSRYWTFHTALIEQYPLWESTQFSMADYTAVDWSTADATIFNIDNSAADYAGFFPNSCATNHAWNNGSSAIFTNILYEVPALFIAVSTQLPSVPGAFCVVTWVNGHAGNHLQMAHADYSPVSGPITIPLPDISTLIGSGAYTSVWATLAAMSDTPEMIENKLYPMTYSAWVVAGSNY